MSKSPLAKEGADKLLTFDELLDFGGEIVFLLLDSLALFVLDERDDFNAAAEFLGGFLGVLEIGRAHV